MKKDITSILLIISLALVLIAVTFKANAQSQERVAGNPIGGIIAKGGHNGVAADVKATNPLYNQSGSTSQNPLNEAKVTGQPIGGIVVKGGQNGAAANVQPANPLYTPSSTDTANPLFQGRSTGSPISGIVVKGGQNPRPSSAVVAPDNGKSISEKGVKRN